MSLKMTNPYLRAKDDEGACIVVGQKLYVPEETHDRVVKALQWEVKRVEQASQAFFNREGML